MGKIFPNATVVVTSRPAVTLHLDGLIDRTIEILGFAQDECDKYISKSFKSHEKLSSLRITLKPIQL